MSDDLPEDTKADEMETRLRKARNNARKSQPPPAASPRDAPLSLPWQSQPESRKD
jgi:hypothetical protein